MTTAESVFAAGVTPARQQLVGNRLALAGVAMYFLEWVGIAAFNLGNVPAGQGTSPAEILAQYTQHGPGIQLLAGWLSLVLLGRILFVAGIRDALRRSGADTLLADFAVLAMAVSVVLEVTAYAIASGGTFAAASGADQSTIVGIDGVANFVNLVLAAPIGVSVLAASIAMVRSRLFPAWLSWVGIAAGIVTCVYGVIVGPAFAAGGTCQSALCTTGTVLPGIAQAISVTLVAAWIWMIATGVVLFRAAGRQRP